MPETGSGIDFGALRAGTPEPTGAPDSWSEFRRAFLASRGALAGFVVIALLVAVALGANWIAPHSPIEQFRDVALAPPAWSAGGTLRFPLGTDPLGRDMLSRLIHGTRLSLAIGGGSVALALLLGVPLGLAAGTLRGRTETVVLRVMDILLALPSLLLAIAVVAILGPGLPEVTIAIGVVLLPHLVRLARAAAIAEVGRDYVTSSRVAGAGPLRLMFATILPNCAAPLIVQSTLGFSSSILDAAALGFLGLGAQPPTPEWGSMLAGALEFIQSAPWVVTEPGLAILVTVLGFNLVGDGLRDALDPRLRL